VEERRWKKKMKNKCRGERGGREEEEGGGEEKRTRGKKYTGLFIYVYVI